MAGLAEASQVDLEEGIDFIVKSYFEAFKHVPNDELEELLVKSRKYESTSFADKDDKTKTKEIKGYLKKTIDCGLEKKPKDKWTNGDNFKTDGYAKAVCLISSGTLNELMTSIGISGKTIYQNLD